MNPKQEPKTIKTVEEFTAWAEGLNEKGHQWLYRGLANTDWEVESAAFRRLRDYSFNSSTGITSSNPQLGILLEQFQLYILHLIDLAHMRGFRRRNGARLSDLELLSELQHYGAATCLIDFTVDPLAALWFACREKPGKHGCVVAVNTENEEDFYNVTPSKLELKIETLINGETLWKWEPHDTNNRIIAQRSVFIFGRPKIEKGVFEEVTVNADDKSGISSSLRSKFGIGEETLFRDFPGFAASHSYDKPYNYDTEALSYLVEEMQRGR